MSKLSYLEKLLNGVDVEWMSLGNIGSFIRGNGLQKKDFVESGFPAIHYGQIYTRYGLSADKTFTYVSPELANKLRKAQRNDLLLATTSENDEDVVKPLAWLGGEAAISGDMMLFRHEQNVKYLAHFFQSEMFQKQKMKYISGAKVRRVSSGDLAKIKTPIPCPNNPEKSLAIQSEIVRILDTFTALTAELTAELTMRKKQYNYYRDQLLSFEEGEVEWKTLGDLGENLDSKRKPITSGLREAGSIPYYGASGIVDYVKDYIFDGDFLLISEDGANLLARNTPIAFSISGKSWVNNHAHVIKFDSYAERRYVEYYLNSIDLSPYISGAAQPKLNKKNLESIRIPNPSPEDKERIVSILDKFDALTNSINEGLPREIELRQKQYEHYRDLLFSFPKPEAASN
ncbi:restriction endonuclease subunit S [Klebsiella pneumoniae]|uniref:restriction endonuclease subunit S n=1 Tax=Klebsiella pneumoniae TaxID=573 RepID=UPI00164B3850|nr:restriction endonuclease subunit S [Klebsiella pneumoniae]MBC5123142.1 restriction endonuclease subunit S [Klebsiella pneumoniae]MCE0151839.1 restriction endonuclease subunit S [Klebsiella pneumoniae]MCP5865136.1 restriction endonuclease subunit S [Klebsiella pneumoniae]MDV2812413.1 restriction endonuclease subunit S [Klebsiella pneumoniae]MDV2922505.1 restriction endonuclease subunit S [Klebsiella pneumoniae]